MDDCGNTSTCDFVVTVVGEDLEITCPPPFAGCPGSNIDPSLLGVATTTSGNNCGVNITHDDVTVLQGACTGTREIDRTWVATRAADGATTSCVQRISIVDNQAPIISNCPQDIRVSPDPNCMAFVSWTPPTASDNCGIASFSSNSGTNSGTFGLGQHTITYTALDNCGQMTTCSFLIIVEGGCCTDDVVISCPPDFTGCPGSSIDPIITGSATSSGTADCPVDVTFSDAVVSQAGCTGTQIIDRTWTSTRVSDGQSISCVQRISLVDEDAPTIVGCPTDITVTAGADCTADVSWISPSVSDDCGVASFVSSTGGETGSFTIGTHTVTYTAIDNCGNTSSCSFVVTVVGAELTISCPATFVGCPSSSLDPADTGTPVVPGGSQCSESMIYNDIVVSQGACTGVREIDRTWIVTRDSDGATASCVQRLSLVDTQAPVITNCPSDIRVTAGTDCQALVSWTPPTASDNCGLATFANNIGSNSGVFDVGQHTITYTATDNCGQVTTCSFVITVEGGCCTADVTINCPADFTGCPGSSVEPSITGSATSSGTTDCPVNISFSDASATQSGCTGSRVIDRTWIATRAFDGATVSCVQRITLIDTIAPTFSSCPANIVVTADANCHATVSWTAPGASDDCGVASITSSVNAETGVFVIGAHTITYTATDNCGNTSTCSFTITVLGGELSISCPATFIGCPSSSLDPMVTGSPATTGGSQCGEEVTYSDVVVSQGACTGVREIDRTWMVTRSTDGATATCVQRLSLIDTEAPVITGCPADIRVTAGTDCQANVSWTPPTASDNCSTPTLVSSTGSNSGVFGVGTHTVSYTATDACGQVTTCSFLVIVEGACCSNSITITCPPAYTGCVSSSTDPSVTGQATSPSSADCPINITFTDAVVSTGACAGTQEINRTWLATRTSDGQTATCVQRISLVDTEAPVISGCPANITVTAGDNCQANVSWTPPTATDNCGLASLVSSTGASSASFEVGTHTITYTATDNCGLITTCSFVVTVQGACCNNTLDINCPPMYTGCPGSSVDPSATGQATSTGSADCPIDVTYSDVILSQGSCSDEREIDRTWVATRVSDGQTISCVQRIRLLDRQTPVITGCPTNITITAGANGQATTSWTAPTATDDCGVATIVSSTGSDGGTFSVGSHTVIYTVTDNCGKSTTCSFIVSVQAGGTCSGGVTITCPGTFVGCPTSSINPSVTGTATSPSSSGCQVEVAYADVIISQGTGCDGSRTIDRIWTATRTDGQTATCTQRIELIDNSAPVISTCVPDVTLSFADRTYTWPDPSVSDICDVTFAYSVPKGTTFNEGTTVVNATVTDACGQTVSCSFSVTVEPANTGSGLFVTCPDDLLLDCGASQSGAVPFPQVTSDCAMCSGGEIAGFVYMGELDGKRYYCSKDRLTWPKAQAFCEASGGQLAVIESSSENAFLANVLQANSAYIGLSDHVSEGTFQWVDGSALSYTRWYPGQPNNYYGFQDYVELLRNGYWNDQTNNKELEFIMEISCLNIQQTSGPTDLSQVNENTTVTFQVQDACGDVSTCSYDILVSGDVSLTCPPNLDIQTNGGSEVVYFNTPDFMTCCNQCNLGSPISGFVFMGQRDGSYYYCSKDQRTWHEANEIARRNGGHLAIIDDDQENNYLAGLLDRQIAFIGVSDQQEEGTWRNVNGATQTYFNWRSDNPNNFGGVQHFVELEPSGKWNDNSGTFKREYIMEIKGCGLIKQVTGPVSGSVFPEGTTTVAFRATDACGNVKTCSFEVKLSTENFGQAAYCDIGGNSSSRAFINKVQINQTILVTGNNGGYKNIASPCISLEEGKTFRLTVTPGWASYRYNAYYMIWIDYNGDGDFDDQSEFVGRAKSANTISGDLLVPYQTIGGPTRMRIAMSLTGYPNSCGYYFYGETEDYCVDLNGSSQTPDSGKNNGKREIEELAPATFTEVEQDITTYFSVYPNPTSDVINLASDVSIRVLSIISTDGRLVKKVANPSTRLDISDLKPGLYLLKMIDDSGLEIAEKLIKQ